MIKHRFNKSGILWGTLAILFFFTAEHISATTAEKQMVVVIDPGHGGKDPGAVNNGVREKDVVLGVGLKLGKIISESYPEVKVIYTRSTDVFIPLIDRSRIANKNKADLFISIHANTCATPSIRGTETFALGLKRSSENFDVVKKENAVILLEDDYKQTYEGFDPNSAESYIMFELTQESYLEQSLSFADDIQRQFQANLNSPNRGVKQDIFLVLRQSSMPSVLIETGFLSNATEARFLASDEGQKSVAQSIFEAFKKFRSRNGGTNLLAERKQQAEKTPEKPAIAEERAPKNLPADTATPKVSATAETVKNPEKEVPATQTVAQTVNQPLETKPKEEAVVASNGYYCIQIGANTTPVDPVPANFKGLKNVTRDKLDKYYRYYVGKETTLENAIVLLNQIKKKFPQAFIVSFIDGKRAIIDLEKKN